MNKVDWYYATPRQVEVLRGERRFTPDRIFPNVRKWSATPTADFVCVKTTDGVKEFLLTRRAEKPWQGEWFIPGGKIAPGVHPVTGCEQNCQRELGFVPKDVTFVDWYPILNPEDQHGGEPYFTQMTLFLVHVSEQEVAKITLDRTAQEMKWFKKIETCFPEPVKQILVRMGFK